MWFWQYRVEILSFGKDGGESIVAGLVTGETIVDAVKALDEYYGEELIDILGCKVITENVFEFKEARAEGFDYEVIYKPKEGQVT